MKRVISLNKEARKKLKEGVNKGYRSHCPDFGSERMQCFDLYKIYGHSFGVR